MIDGLDPYSRMKDSGVTWLGEVPEHWDVLPNRAVFREVIERDHPDEDMLSVTISRGVVRQDALLIETAKKDSSNLDKSAYKLVHPADIVYNKMRAWQGAIGVSDQKGIVSPAYIVQRLRNNANPRYFHYLLRTPAFAKEAERWSYGITSDMWSLRPEHLKMIYLCVPPDDEHEAIARFLDHADQRIRRYIRAQQKLINLLREQKQAVIHRAVTRGLEANVRLKPSGVDWLGDIPVDWRASRLGRLVELVTGFPFESEGFSQAENDVRLLRGINISPGKVRWNHVVRWPFRDRGNFSAFELDVGDIVLGMDRPVIQNGVRVAVIESADVPSLLLQRVARIRPQGELRADFLVMLLAGKGFSDYLAPIFTGISVPHLSPEQIRSYRFALPSLEEQERIVKWLAATTGSLESAKDAARRELELVREYRTRLIADVVTGKLDVREAAAGLPNEVEETETLDEQEILADAEKNAPEELEDVLEGAEA